LRSSTSEAGNMKLMAESRGERLRECRAQRTAALRGVARLDLHLHAAGAKYMAQLVHDSALLCRDQQQQ
jgi:hypothetical protein